MTGYEAEIVELNAALQANRVATATITAEVREKYRTLIQAEIAARKQEADLAFARRLKEVKERSGIPVTLIQDEVLRTRSWNVWTKWRDLAELPSGREARPVKTVEPEKGYRVNGDTLIITHDPNGAELLEPVAYALDTATKGPKRWSIEPFPGADAEQDVALGQKFYGRWLDLISNAVEEVRGG